MNKHASKVCSNLHYYRILWELYLFPEVKKLTVGHNMPMASLYQPKEKNKKALEGRLNSSLTTQWNRAPYGIWRVTTCSVQCFPIKKQEQTAQALSALQGNSQTHWTAFTSGYKGLNKNGQVSTSFDLNQQNKVLRRSTVVFTVDSIFPRWVPKFYSLLDAANGFWQMVLHPDGAKLTSFIMPFGW